MKVRQAFVIDTQQVQNCRVQVMNVDEGDHVASVARVDQAEGDPDAAPSAEASEVEVIAPGAPAADRPRADGGAAAG